VSMRMHLWHGVDFFAEYERDRSVRSFITPWAEENTRIQLSRRIGDMAWGLFFNVRPGDTVTGLVFTRGADSGEPLPLVPASRYRKPYTNPAAKWEFNTGSLATCEKYRSFDEMAASLDTPERVSEYSNCLNFGSPVDTGKISTPMELVAGAEANCHATAWLQSQLLTRQGHESFVVVFQGNKWNAGRSEEPRFSVYHAVTAYRDPETATWDVMDYDEVIKTGAPTIQEAMEIYNPGILTMVIEEPGKLQSQGVFLNPALETVRAWMRDSD
jgi:hypothetical protein